MGISAGRALLGSCELAPLFLGTEGPSPGSEPIVELQAAKNNMAIEIKPKVSFDFL
jgi:hypothetical protein